MQTEKDRQTGGLWSLAILVVVATCTGWSLTSVLAGDAPKLPSTSAPEDYQITAVGATHQAVNRAQGLRLRFTQAGIRVLPRADDAFWSVELTLDSYGAPDAIRAVLPGATKVVGTRFEQTFGGGISWSHGNTENGIIQSFTLSGPAGQASPDGFYSPEIRVSLTAVGLEARTAGDGSVVFVTPGGREVLRYSLVGGVDAGGAPVPVKVALVNSPNGSTSALQFIPVVDAKENRQPVTVQLRLDTQDLKSEAEAETGTPAAALLAAPPEDTCAGAQVIPAGTYPVLSATVDNSSATDTGDPANTCQTNSHLGLWYTFTPTTADTYIVTTCATQAPGTTRTDTVLAVFTSAAGCTGAFTQVACNDDYRGCSANGLQSRLTFAGTAGTTYYILAYSFGTTGGAFQIQIDKPQPPPPNDVCAGAQTIPGGPAPYLTAPVNNTWATSTNDPNTTCGTGAALGLWYTFTPTVGGQYYITTCQGLAPGNTRTDTILDIFSSTGGCAGPFTELANGCNDDNANCTGRALQSLIQPVLEAGKTYYILAYNYGATTFGDIQLYVDLSPPPSANDQCAGAQVIPPAGPFPYLTATVDVTSDATVGDPTAWSCTAAVTHIAWYQFAPTERGTYSFTTCANQASGTTCLDTVLGVFTSTGGCAGPFTNIACNDNDSGCSNVPGLSTVSADMQSGQTYYVLVGGPGASVPQPGKVQIEVTYIPPPPNDNCSAPTLLLPGIPQDGSTVGAANDYQLSATAPTCFTLPTPPAPIGQIASQAPGRDVVYEFIPPANGSYSCRAYSYDTAQNLVLYVATSCPAATAGTPVTISNPPCVGASNRSTSSWQEEVMCVPMTGGTPYFVFVDNDGDGTILNTGSEFFVKCAPCVREVEPNNTPAQANPFVCGIEGSIDPAGDVDFFQLVGAGTGSRVFAMADGGAALAQDTTMRITTSADTLEFDDDDLGAPFGEASPTIDGVTLANGPPYYIKMEYHTGNFQTEPYRLYSVVEPALGSAIPETEPNDTLATANSDVLNYFKGTMGTTTDADWYAFTANAGDIIFMGLDADPNYDGTANNNVLELYDSAGQLLVKADGSSGVTATLNRSPSLGTLAAISPSAPGEALEWDADYDGTYYAKVTTASGSGQEYLLAISKNCGTQTTDFDITVSGTPDSIQTGQNLTYTIVVTNHGPSDCSASMSDPIPLGMTFVSASATAGWTCSGPPVGGAGAVNCSGFLADGSSTTITIVVKGYWCTARVISNTASVSSACPDSNPTNDSATTTTTATLPPAGAPCDDGDPCTVNDQCDGGGHCAGAPKDCHDDNSCTDDSCTPGTGVCAHAARQIGVSCACRVGGSCQCTGSAFGENFDNVTAPALPAGWTDSPGGSWNTENTVRDTAPNAAFSPDPATVSDQALISPAFIADPNGSQMSFRHQYAFEGTSTCLDGGVLEISINAGAWQDIIAAGGAWVTGGYTGTVYTLYSNPLAGRAAWCFNTASAFITTTVTLPPAAGGQPVQLRWRLGADSSVSATGWYIDTISIPTCNIGCVGGAPVSVPPVGNSLRVTGGTGAVIRWTDPPGPFNVYRGLTTKPWTYDHTCFEIHNAMGQITDTELPPGRGAFYYLVTRQNADYCESIPGVDSRGTAEPNPHPCP